MWSSKCWGMRQYLLIRSQTHESWVSLKQRDTWYPILMSIVDMNCISQNLVLCSHCLLFCWRTSTYIPYLLSCVQESRVSKETKERTKSLPNNLYRIFPSMLYDSEYLSFICLQCYLLLCMLCRM